MRPRSARASCLVVALAAGGLGCASGCEAISPTNLWKLNRHPPLGRDDAYFSIRNEELTSAGPAATAKFEENDAALAGF